MLETFGLVAGYTLDFLTIFFGGLTILILVGFMLKIVFMVVVDAVDTLIYSVQSRKALRTQRAKAAAMR